MKLKDLTPTVIEALTILERLFENRDFVTFVKLLFKQPASDVQAFCSAFLTYKDQSQTTLLPNLRTPELDILLSNLIASYQLELNAKRLQLLDKVRQIHDELLLEQKPYLRDLL